MEQLGNDFSTLGFDILGLESLIYVDTSVRVAVDCGPKCTGGCSGGCYTCSPGNKNG